MTINTDLLVAAPMLQNIFVNKDGTPMIAGTITCYRDNSRTTLKNWYYQSGISGSYTYIRLPNPLTLSAAGTICDINGVDTIPFFYPYSEQDQNESQPYYITIVSEDQTNQITRENFPFMAGQGRVSGAGTNDNYIINNRFWRNIGTVNLTNILQKVVAPSQHDGFRYSDIQFIKNIAGGQDTLTFAPFALTQTPILADDITPEFYINHVCSNAQGGETQKCYQFPVSLHVNTLASVPYSFTIQAKNNGGISGGRNVIRAFILQDTGVGTTSPDLIEIGSITLTPEWDRYTFTKVFPSTEGLTLGQGGDDALYLQIQMPLGVDCNLDFCLPSIYLNDEVPTNSFATYDQINAVINSPRTGDTRIGFNGFYPFGWLPMNDYTIGNTGSIASGRANTDTWPLYNLLWNLGHPYNVNPNAISQMYNPSAVAITYGSSAIADFTAGNVLLLPLQLGKVIMGTAPIESLTTEIARQPVAFSNLAGNILVTGIQSYGFFVGQPVSFSVGTGSLPSNIFSNRIYYMTHPGIGGSELTFQLADTLPNAYAGTIKTFTTAGTSTIFMNSSLTATSTGENYHTQKSDEVTGHTHAAISTTTVTIPQSGVPGSNAFLVDGAIQSSGSLPATTVTTILANTPAGRPFNIIQSGVFHNIFMKL